MVIDMYWNIVETMHSAVREKCDMVGNDIDLINLGNELAHPRFVFGNSTYFVNKVYINFMGIVTVEGANAGGGIQPISFMGLDFMNMCMLCDKMNISTDELAAIEEHNEQADNIGQL